jgi:hypothetical protein
MIVQIIAEKISPYPITIITIDITVCVGRKKAPTRNINNPATKMIKGHLKKDNAFITPANLIK